MCEGGCEVHREAATIPFEGFVNGRCQVAKCAGEKASGQLIKLLEHESAKKAGGGSTTVRVGAEQAGMGQEDDEWTEAGSDLEELQCADLDGAKSAAQMPQ
eukprot:gene17230-20499_t